MLKQKRKTSTNENANTNTEPTTNSEKESRTYEVLYYNTSNNKVSSTETSKEDLAFWIYKPERVKNAKIPMIVFLHGADERGELNELKNMYPFKLEENDYEAIVIYPLCSDDKKWDHIGFKVKGLVDYSIQNYNVDENRVALTGFSFGGSGAWQIGLQYPTTFSCVVPVCPYSNRKALTTYPDCPVWVFGSTQDRAIDGYSSSYYAKNINDQLVEDGKQVKLEIYNIEHRATCDKAYSTELINWMIARNRKTNSSYRFP